MEEKMETQIKKRIDWLDIAKGIAIICTIVGHNVPFGGNIRNIIFSFHMPLFFVLAGYTIKQIPYKNFGSTILKDFKRLVVPVFIIKVIQFLLEILINHTEVKSCAKTIFISILWGNGCNYYFFPGVGAVWFLLALFFSKLLFRLCLNLIQRYRLVFFLTLTFVFSVFGRKLWLPQNFDLLFPAMLFMYSGYVFRKEIDEDSKYIKFIGFFCFIFWTYMAWNKGIYIELATRSYPFSMVSILIALCGTLCVIQFSKSIESMKISKSLVFVGKYSLDLLCIHLIDNYLSFLWTFIIFTGNAKLIKINSYLQLIFHVLIDILVLIVWIFVKEKIFIKLFYKIKS
ncbi:MAG: acyltransferase family protein [Treponema sp.]|nr:acyltransferase family protein [Treponema sp.]